MALPQNAYPGFDNFQEVSFPQEVTPPDVDPDVDVQCVSYNPAWAMVLMSACSQLTQVSAWKGTLEEKNLAVSRALTLKERLQRFNEDCVSCGCPEAMIRINADGTADRSVDGGVTWTPAVGTDDPRNPSVIVPVPSGSPTDSKRCAAANSIVSAFKQAQEAYYNAKLASESEAQFAAILIGFLVAVGVIATGGALAVLGAGLAVLMTTVDAATFNAAFDDTLWSDFLCTLYCEMDGDGQLTDAKVRSIQTHVAAYSGIAGSWFDGVFKSLTAESMNNYANQQRPGDLSCSGCGCGCNTAVWDAYPDYGTSVVRGVDSDGRDYIEADAVQHGSNYYIIFTSDADDACCNFHSWTTISGDTGSAVISWCLCNETPRTGECHSGILTSGSINSSQMQKAGAFRGRLTFET